MPIRPNSFAFTVLLAGMAALPSLSIDMSLPAMPLLVGQFGASPGQAGLTLSLFMAGFAVAQRLFGPVSDRLGRRPALLGGIVLFTVSALCCALAPNITLLNVFRLLQGTGAAAGMAMSLAIVRDLFSGAKARVKLSYVAVVVGIAPILGPTLGSVILTVAGWRAIFALHSQCEVKEGAVQHRTVVVGDFDEPGFLHETAQLDQMPRAFAPCHHPSPRVRSRSCCIKPVARLDQLPCRLHHRQQRGARIAGLCREKIGHPGDSMWT